MGLAFQVGQASEVFVEGYAPLVDVVLEQRFGLVTPVVPDDHYCSDDLAWSAWERLQDQMRAALGESSAKTMLAFEAWKTTFLPIRIEPQAVGIASDSSLLCCASLPNLRAELEAFHEHLGLPSSKEALLTRRAQLEEALDEADADEDELNVQQMLNELLFAALEAERRHQPLWVVK